MNKYIIVFDYGPYEGHGVVVCNDLETAKRELLLVYQGKYEDIYVGKLLKWDIVTQIGVDIQESVDE